MKVWAKATSSNCSARTPISTPSWEKKKPTRKSAGINPRTWSTGRSTSSEAAVKVSAATTRPRMKPPSEKASSSSSGEAGEESWSWIAPWNFCWDRGGVIGEGVDRPSHHDQAGDDEYDVIDPVQLGDPGPEGGPEDRDVEEGFQQRRADRLLLDLHEAVDLAAPEGEEADQRGGAHDTASGMWERASSLPPTRPRWASSGLGTQKRPPSSELVPSATISPSLIKAIRSQSCSASSRSWVVSRIVVPSWLIRCTD